ncbi:PTS system, glucose-specific IIA component [Gracilibacillus orientalis]|uniref:PTS system, glucose-specific IIA component n=1 Tax=Gracilibacillus orientalis TaxID=334253 RepID=A0A1I4IJW0_9BACI|nr:PTS glucose transporter subunit IIA [Gracilibacillus orientalis]SFL54367.1 PTS system, glucose-specific IIA component [Gracilibacillus orientalis]
MLKNIFKKKEANTDLIAPLSGKVIPLGQVPDQVFSQKMMGDGVAIEPADKQVVSPVDGEVVDVFKTKHAVSLKTDGGAEILVHMGLETVELDGKGFDIQVENGQKLKKGDPLATFDINTIAAEGYKTVTPVILLNGEEFAMSNIAGEQDAIAGEDVLFHIEKK